MMIERIKIWAKAKMLTLFIWFLGKIESEELATEYITLLMSDFDSLLFSERRTKRLLKRGDRDELAKKIVEGK